MLDFQFTRTVRSKHWRAVRKESTGGVADEEVIPVVIVVTGCWVLVGSIRLHDPMPGASELDLRAKSSLKYPTTE